MKLTDIVSRIVIDHRKLVDYALNPKSPLGCHKPIVFERLLGFTLDNYIDLLKQIEKSAATEPIFLHSKDEFGYRYNMDITINGTKERQAVVRIGWFIPYGIDEARLVTLFVRG